MFCKSCGKQIDNDSAFCTYCGTKQSANYKPQSHSDSSERESNTPIDTPSDSSVSQKKTEKQPKYDPSYEKESDAVFIGVVLIVAFIFLALFPIEFERSPDFKFYRTLMGIGSLILRIGITVWVVNIAKRQNREPSGWGFFAFFLPSIALIVIGTQKKLYAQIHVNESLDDSDNSSILTNKAKEYLDDKKYQESIRFLQKAIELDFNNQHAKELLKDSKIAISEEVNTKTGHRTMYRETSDGRLLTIVSKRNLLGAHVYVDDQPASDGECYFDNYSVIIADGIIAKVNSEFQHLKEYSNYKLLQAKQDEISIGDKAFYKNGPPLSDGRYDALGIKGAWIEVRNGVISDLNMP